MPVQEVLQKLSFTACGELNPMTAMFGGVVGQEVMKAASGKFHPLYQFFYFDSIESLPEEALLCEDVAPLVRCRPVFTHSSHIASIVCCILSQAQLRLVVSSPRMWASNAFCMMSFLAPM